MLTTVQRLRLYGLGIMFAVVVAGLLFYVQARSRLNDIRLVSELRSLAYGLEHHYHDFLAYPEVQIDARQVTVLSDSGFKSGTVTYYHGIIRSNRPVMYQSDGSNYRITFRLRSNWPEQGLPGTYCTIETNYVLTCTGKP